MSNLLSNQKFIHSVSPLVASNGHKLPIEDLVYKNEPCWAYILHNIKNGMWYIGISTQHPDEYKTTSDNKELAMAFSRNEIKNDSTVSAESARRNKINEDRGITREMTVDEEV